MDFRDIERAAQEQGWRTDTTRKGHRRFWPRDGSPPEVFSGTPSDQRAIRNFVASLRRKGFEWPWTARDRRERRKKERE